MTHSAGTATTDELPMTEVGTDPLELLTEAITTYFEEIDDCLHTCLRHERTTMAYDTPRALHLVRLFPRKADTLAHLRLTVARLRGWEESPFWQRDKGSWTALQRDTAKRHPAGTERPLLTRGVAWEGKPSLVCVSPSKGQSHFRVELLLPPTRQDLPELPLRTVASGLRCHEYLLPEGVARAVPTMALPPPCLPLLVHLRRATPQGLYASKCLSLHGAEQ